MTSPTAENYLKQILLGAEPHGGVVTMGDLAGRLGVVPGTVTTMVKAMAAAGWVRYTPRRGVRLTGAGHRLAANVQRRHRLVETFLVRVLKMNWAEVHAEAEQLEHAISPAVLDRLDALLGHPAADPHGDPIPARSGRIPRRESSSLATLAAGQECRIARVTDQSPGFLQFAEERDLLPGRTCHVVRQVPAADLTEVRRGEGPVLALPRAAAASFLVRRRPGPRP